MVFANKAKASWPLAMEGIAEAAEQSPEVVRMFLDSRDGRAFADEVVGNLDRGLELPAAVGAAIKRWMEPAKNSSVTFPQLPANTPYLTACILSQKAEAAEQ